MIISVRFESESNRLDDDPVAAIDNSTTQKLKQITDAEYQRYSEVLIKANVKSVDDFEILMVLNEHGEQQTDDIKMFLLSLDADIHKSKK